MRLNRTLFGVLAMLLALMLPLQGYAAMPDCGPVDAVHSGVRDPAASPTAPQHCAGVPAATHRHGCGNCCCSAAIMPTPVRWIAPILAAPEISAAAPWSPPTVALDRLDRPPRFILA
jgi:hypothetical protein